MSDTLQLVVTGIKLRLKIEGFATSSDDKLKRIGHYIT
jgi:hypothetical protein